MLDRATVDHIAELARLRLSKSEREELRAQLSAVLEHFERLSAFDDSDAVGTPAARTLSDLRSDVVTPSLPREPALANAEHTEDGQFLAPTVFE